MTNWILRGFVAGSAALIAYIDVCLIRSSPVGVRSFGELVLGMGLQIISLAGLYAVVSKPLARMGQQEARNRVGMGLIAAAFLFVFTPDIVAGACYNEGANKLVDGEKRRRAREQCCFIQFSHPAS